MAKDWQLQVEMILDDHIPDASAVSNIMSLIWDYTPSEDERDEDGEEEGAF